MECNMDGEDSACSASIPSHGLNLAHATVCFIIIVIIEIWLKIASILAFWPPSLSAYENQPVYQWHQDKGSLALPTVLSGHTL